MMARGGREEGERSLRARGVREGNERRAARGQQGERRARGGVGHAGARLVQRMGWALLWDLQ